MLHMCAVQGQRTSYGTSRYVNEGSSVWRKCALPSSPSVLCSFTHQTLHAVVLKRQYLFRNAAGVCSTQSRKWRCMDILSSESKRPALTSALKRSHMPEQIWQPILSSSLQRPSSESMGSGDYGGMSFHIYPSSGICLVQRVLRLADWFPLPRPVNIQKRRPVGSRISSYNSGN
jgi:hypothetical protein